jgi:cell division protein FtsB
LFYHWKLVNTKLHPNQGQKQHTHNYLKTQFSNRTKLNKRKENRALKLCTSLSREILQVITENLVEMILDMVNQNVQEALKKFQDTKNKKYKRTQEQISDIIGDLNKHQSKQRTL